MGHWLPLNDLAPPCKRPPAKSCVAGAPSPSRWSTSEPVLAALQAFAKTTRGVITPSVSTSPPADWRSESKRA
jgi:hypothetical protein